MSHKRTNQLLAMCNTNEGVFVSSIVCDFLEPFIQWTTSEVQQTEEL